MNLSVFKTRFEVFSVPSLMDFVARDIGEVLLDPINALTNYLSRPKQYHLAFANFFVSAIKRKKRVSWNTISFWNRLVIIQAYGSATNDDCRALKVNAYEVWKVGTSCLFRRNCAVKQVLKVDAWSFQTTLSAFYIFEMSPACSWTPFSLALWQLLQRGMGALYISILGL